MKDDLANSIRIFLQENGIDPVYFTTLVVIAVMISYRKQIQNWEDQEDWQKGIIMSAAFATSVLVIISLLQLFGFIQW